MKNVASQRGLTSVRKKAIYLFHALFPELEQIPSSWKSLVLPRYLFFNFEILIIVFTINSCLMSIGDNIRASQKSDRQKSKKDKRNRSKSPNKGSPDQPIRASMPSNLMNFEEDENRNSEA